MSKPPLIFIGADTGLDGALASLTVDPAPLPSILAVHMVAMPTRTREDKGREVKACETLDALRYVAQHGWTRCLVERPVRGGMGRQGTGVEFAQGDAHGVVRACLEIEAVARNLHPPEPVGVSGCDGWHGQLAMQSAKAAGVDRKTLSITVAEGLLVMLRQQGATIHGLPACRGYSGIIGGQQAPRSGAADAVLIAWLALRLWLGVPAGAPTHCLDPAWRPESKPKAPRSRNSPPRARSIISTTLKC